MAPTGVVQGAKMLTPQQPQVSLLALWSDKPARAGTNRHNFIDQRDGKLEVGKPLFP